jgi:hypothetical protein
MFTGNLKGRLGIDKNIDKEKFIGKKLMLEKLKIFRMRNLNKLREKQ